MTFHGVARIFCGTTHFYTGIYLYTWVPLLKTPHELLGPISNFQNLFLSIGGNYQSKLANDFCEIIKILKFSFRNQ